MKQDRTMSSTTSSSNNETDSDSDGAATTAIDYHRISRINFESSLSLNSSLFSSFFGTINKSLPQLSSSSSISILSFTIISLVIVISATTITVVNADYASLPQKSAYELLATSSDRRLPSPSLQNEPQLNSAASHPEEVIFYNPSTPNQQSTVVGSHAQLSKEQESQMSKNGDPSYNYYVTSRSQNDAKNGHQPMTRFEVAKFDFDHVSTPYIVSLWVIIVGLAKICFHVTPKLSSCMPESVVLMILGVVIGLIMYFAGIPEERLQPLTPNLFFLYMLPPIVMDAGYHMPNRLFFDNLTTILLYAVVGTIWNAVAIGFSLYGCSILGAFGDPIPFLDIMLFSSTVSAVDPVAVLAVFEQIHVNEVLYILVFGESLLNDAVTVVLYHMFEGYAEMAYHNGFQSILTVDYLAGFASFFVVAVGGTMMGVFWGFLAAFVSRFTHHVKIIEPIFVFVMAYLSYLSAEMFHLSGILSLTFCGITMKNYVEENITQKSHTTLKYAMKMLANSSEAIIFVFLGVCTVNDQHHWNTAFVTLTIIFCLVYRTMGVIALTAITNKFRLHRVNRVEQFIMAYGGLRGAVAFALILIINKQIIHARAMMVTTIIAVVYFTVFLQGMTVGALVRILKVPRANKFEMSMNERIHTRLMDHVMAGLEDISGMMMGNYKLRDKFRYYNNRYLRKWLLRDSKEMGNSSRKIFETCSRLDLQDAMNLVSKQHLYTATSTNPTQMLKNQIHQNHNNLNNNNNNVNNLNHNNIHGSKFLYYNNTNIPNNNNNNGPSIFLTVPQSPNIGIAFPQSGVGPGFVDPNQSLTTLFRSYTQSNLSALNNIGDDHRLGLSAPPPPPGGTAAEGDPTKVNNHIIESNSIPIGTTMFDNDFNYDIGNISYSPSMKDLDDAEIHHILNDAMFKPFKKFNHYTRSDYSEPQPAHPPFQHQVRMQIRHLISQSEKNRRRESNESAGSGDPGSGRQVGGSLKETSKYSKHSNRGSVKQNNYPNKSKSLKDSNQMRKDRRYYFDQNRNIRVDDIEMQNQNKNNTGNAHRHEPNNRKSKPITDDNGNMIVNEEDEDEDDGIVFTAKHNDAFDADGEDHLIDNNKKNQTNSGVVKPETNQNQSKKVDINDNKLDVTDSNDNEQGGSVSGGVGDDDYDDNDDAFDVKVDNQQQSQQQPTSTTNKPKFVFPWRRTSSTGTPSGSSSPGGVGAGGSGSANRSPLRRESSRTSTSSRSSTGSNPHHHHHHHYNKKKGLLKDGAVRQREFPPWIENRDYVYDYASPTTTLLERINLLNHPTESDQLTESQQEQLHQLQQQQQQHQQQQQSSNNPFASNASQHSMNGRTQVPSVYEIFQIDKSGMPLSPEQQPLRSPASPSPDSSPTPPQSFSSLQSSPSPPPPPPATTTPTLTEITPTNSEDTVIQFFQHNQPEPTQQQQQKPTTKAQAPDNKTQDSGSSGLARDQDNDDDDTDDDDHSIMISKL